MSVFLFLVICATIIERRFGKVTAMILATSSVILPATCIANLEVRMYSWAYFFVFMSFIALYDILKSESLKFYISFMIFSLCAAYTHYYALLMVAFFYVVLIIHAIFTKRWKKTFTIVVLTILAYLPWLGILYGSFKRTSENWWLESVPSLVACVTYIFGNSTMVKLFIFLVVGYLIKVLEVWEFRTAISPAKILRKDLLVIEGFKGKFNVELWWILSGIFCCVGTIAIGEIMSYVIRPFLVLRYLVPLVSIMWIIMGVVIRKFKYGNIIGILLVSYLLYSFMPNYISTYKYEKKIDKNLEDFLEEVEIIDGDIILTNHANILFLLDYYYPNIVRKYITDDSIIEEVIVNEEFEKVYLFLNSDTSEEVLESIGEAIRSNLVKVSADGLVMSKSNMNLYVYKY